MEYAAARAALPDVDVPADQFAAFVADKGPLDELHLTDLYLACACAAGNAAALAHFERECVPAIERAVTAAGATAAERTELAQIVRTRLLVGDPPRIATYSGRGALRSWIRVVAVRESARLLAKERRNVPLGDDALALAFAPDAGPELAYLAERYRAEFKRAFHAAVESLTDRERLLLRQHELDGLSIDELAAFYRVHRATAARWVSAARDVVLVRTRETLGAQLGASTGEVDSIMRLVRANLDISLPSLLTSPR